MGVFSHTLYMHSIVTPNCQLALVHGKSKITPKQIKSIKFEHYSELNFQNLHGFEAKPFWRLLLHWSRTFVGKHAVLFKTCAAKLLFAIASCLQFLLQFHGNYIQIPVNKNLLLEMRCSCCGD